METIFNMPTLHSSCSNYILATEIRGRPAPPFSEDGEDPVEPLEDFFIHIEHWSHRLQKL